MSVIIQETSSTVRTLEVSISQEIVTEEFNKKVSEYRKDIQLKGFRVGKVPRNVIVQRFGESIRNEVIDSVINAELQKELDAAGVVPVAPGRMEDFKDDKESDLTFKLIVEVDPPVTVEGYKDTGFKVPEVMINASEVTDELNQMQNMYADYNKVERAAQKGDSVEGVYLKVIIDGEERPLPNNPQFRALIGDTTTPGFDEGLIGTEAGTEKEVLFTYPADHKDEFYRGKSAAFTVRVNAVNEVVLPELDDKFAEKLGMKTFEELKERLEESISQQRTQQAKSKVQEEALDFLMEKNVFDVPEARIKQWVEHTLRQQGANADGEVTPTEEQIEAMRADAEREIRKYRILDAIVEQENLKPTQDDVDAQIKEMAAAYGIDFNTLKTQLRQSGRINEMREDLKIQKALDLIVGA